ncbi:MAG: hypothetical protein L0Y72_28360 [Gemmataceae bacterium]|nr:hypothetical protein [Gemmataceae bacterium]MCI0742961.1 hypothetical protein [Gemmataceae bacterium]
MSAGETWTLDKVKELIGDVLRPGRFFVSRDLKLTWEPPAEEEIPWELFRGQLLPVRFSRQTRRFLAWNIYKWENETRADEPLLSVKLDQERGEIHVVRGILAYVWEPFDSGGNVIESREVQRWTRELVGTLRWQDYDEILLVGELEELVWQGLVGTSRLPLNSVETPLPEFVLGRFGYFRYVKREGEQEPIRDWRALLDLPKCYFNRLEQTARSAGTAIDSADGHPFLEHIWLYSILELLLRTMQPSDIDDAVEKLIAVKAHYKWNAELNVPFQCKILFNNTSLTPYTQLPERAFSIFRRLVTREAIPLAGYVDFLRDLIIKLCRHLTAYDLITYHHRGANYPDALVLDQALNELILIAEKSPASFERDGPADAAVARRKRRRALRQGCLLRRYYEGLAVPDAPTTPGENVRVLPAPHVRVPEEQLTNVLKRTRRLYEGESLQGKIRSNVRHLIDESIQDLLDSAEWKLLGQAIFVDRPLDWADDSPHVHSSKLVSHLCFSRSIAERRAHELRQFSDGLGFYISAEKWQKLEELLREPIAGVPVASVAQPPIPIIALSDARNVAADFIVERTYAADWLFWSFASDDLCCRLHLDQGFWQPGLRDKVRATLRMPRDKRDSVIVSFDSKFRRRLELVPDFSQGFTLRHGTSLPRAGLRLLRGWEYSQQYPEGRLHDLTGQRLQIRR